MLSPVCVSVCPLQVSQGNVPGVESASLAMDTEEGVEVVWNEVLFSDKKVFKAQEVTWLLWPTTKTGWIFIILNFFFSNQLYFIASLKLNECVEICTIILTKEHSLTMSNIFHYFTHCSCLSLKIMVNFSIYFISPQRMQSFDGGFTYSYLCDGCHARSHKYFNPALWVNYGFKAVLMSQKAIIFYPGMFHYLFCHLLATWEKLNYES